MRLALPDLDQEEQVHQSGIAIINLLGIDFFKFINASLESSDGVDWLTNYRKSSLIYQNYNFNDPSNLLKELLRVSTSPLRKPIKTTLVAKDIVAFFNRLQVILDDRNDWVHHNSHFLSDKLKTLILNVYPVAEKLDLEVKIECDFLLAKLDGVEPDVPQEVEPVNSEIQSDSEIEMVKNIQTVMPQNERAIGELIEDKFSEFSYVLHISGEIRDRKTNQLLSEIKPEFASALGALLIARKPHGGRLRVTDTGVIAAYFEDHWGYLAKVTSDQWFSDHLFDSV